MKRVTYYLMKGSENDGYYFKPGVTNEQGRERIGAMIAAYWRTIKKYSQQTAGFFSCIFMILCYNDSEKV